MTQMSQREKLLAWLVGGAVFFVLNIVAIKFLMKNYQTLTVDRETVEGKIRGLKMLETERALWTQRNQYLDESLPTMGDSEVANRQLIDGVKNVGKKYTITLEAPQPGVPLKQPLYTLLSTRMEAKGSWTQMFDFIQELQAPGQFISVEGDIKVDPADKTQLRAALNIAKWYQPELK